MGRAPSQKEVAILVARKRTRAAFANQGDLVMLAVNDHDQLVVDPVGTSQVIGLLGEIRDLLKINNELLERQR